MLTFLADENFDGDILAGVRRRCSEIDIVRVQDIGLSRAADPILLAWAADAGRLLLTHDVATVTKLAYERVGEGLPMPGVVEVPWLLPVGRAVDDLVTLTLCSRDGEWEGQIIYLPL